MGMLFRERLKQPQVAVIVPHITLHNYISPLPTLVCLLCTELYDEANVTDLMVHGRAEKGERKRELIAAQDGIFNPSILTQRPKVMYREPDSAVIVLLPT